MREQRHWLYYGVIICLFKVLAVLGLNFQDSLLAKSNQRSKTYKNKSATIKLAADPVSQSLCRDTLVHCEEFLNSPLSCFFNQMDTE